MLLSLGLEYKGGMYGYYGYHKGFGELMAQLLTTSFMRVEKGGSVGSVKIRSSFLERLIEVHMKGISDTALNKRIRKLMHHNAAEKCYSKGFSYLYLYKGGYQSTRLRNTFLNRDKLPNTSQETKEYYEKEQKEIVHVNLMSLALSQLAIR